MVSIEPLLSGVVHGILQGRAQLLSLLAGLRMKNLDVGALQAVFEVLQQHYPERLGELWFLNAPFIFWGLWRVVSPFIQQGTKDKIKFLSGKDRERMLQQHIPKDVSVRAHCLQLGV